MVEWKNLGEIARRNKGIPITARQMSELASSDGNVRVFAAGSTIADIDETKLPKNCAHKLPSIIVKSRGYIDFEFYEKPFTHKNEMWSYSFVNKQEGKFIYYFLTTKTELFRTKAKANSVKLPQLCVADTDNYLIPIPSIEEQNRIVGILDTFTASIDNLKEQIAQRRKQYEYYRDQLLDLEGKEGVEMKMLGDFCDTLSGFPFDSSQFRDEGIQLMRGANIKRGYFDFSQELNKYWISSEGLEKYLLEPNDIIISMDGSLVGRSFCYLRSDHLPLLLVQRVARIRTKENYKYVYYNITKSFPDYVDKKKTAGAIPHISMKDINSFIIPVPSLSEQQRIVDILDKFEASIQNLEAQLSQREKQYEYYRNKLLTFE